VKHNPHLILSALLALLLSVAVGQSQTTITVPAGGDLQAAIGSAQLGDRIILEADKDYTCSCVFPVKTGTGYISIESSRYAEIPVRDFYSKQPAADVIKMMPRIKSNHSTEPVFRASAGSHHFKLLGLNIAPPTGQAYSIVELGVSSAAQDTLAEMPHSFVIDKSWIHGGTTQEVQRCVALNSGSTDITNSWITDCHGVGYDTQAIGGWNGAGPYNITNNLLEGAGENVMFGGALALIPNLVPSNIVIRGNYIFKPLTWKVGHTSYAGIHWSIKNLLELKNARNVIIDRNVLENSWGDAQIGYAVLFTVRGEGNNQMPWATIQNVEFTNNIVKNSDQGIQTLGFDYSNASTQSTGLLVKNNLFENISNWFFVLNGFHNTTIENNTHIQGHNILVLTGRPSNGFIYRNNITVRNPNGYGVFNDGLGEGAAGMATYTPNYVFVGNVIASASANIYPQGNYFPGILAEVKLGDNYTLSADSPYKGKGTDGKDPGVDMRALVSGLPTPTPTPTPAPTPVPTPSPVPTPTPPVTSCVITVPDGINVPRNGSATINVNVSGVTSAVVVSHTGSDGQVKVTPLSKTAVASSNVLAFQVVVKRQSRTIVFNSACGSRSVKVNVAESN
jgi:hypothetical protein